MAPEAVILEYDWYYQDLAHRTSEQRVAVNFDHPDALDTELLLHDLRQMLSGHAIQAPDYDFARHLRVPAARELAPRPFIILEGIHALVEPRLRALMALKVYVDCPSALRLSRRIQRDTLERGRTLESVLQQSQQDVEPMHAQFVEQSRVHADLVLGGQRPVEDNVEVLLQRLRQIA